MAARVGYRGTLKERFERKYSVDAETGCWNWHASKSRRGYGQMRVQRRGVLATHVSLELAGFPRTGEKPCALHSCDNPACVNPDHLRWGTLRDNSSDAIARGRADLSGLKIGHEKMRSLRTERETKQCDQCGTRHTPRRDQLAKNRNFFCSTACSVAWQKATYTGKPIATWSAK